MWPLDWAALVALLLGPALLAAWRSLSPKCRQWRQRGRDPHRPEVAEAPGADGDADADAGHDVGDVPGERRPRRLAAKPLGTLTVGLSLLASNLSGITLLGYPAEVYRYGSQFCAVAVGAVLATAVLSVAYLPVLHGLDLDSAYEYLELRFDGRVRKLASIMYTGRLLLLLPLVIFVPALAFNQATGIGIPVVAPVLGLGCIAFSIAGGLRGVALTGSIQLGVMLSALLALLAAGLFDVGGLGVVWQRMADTGRLELFNLDPNPLTRTTFWSAFLGGAFFWLQMLAVQPNSVQRYLAVPTLAAARRTAYLQCAGLVLTTALTCLLGAVLVAKYAGCDPLRTGEAQRADQLVALLVARTSDRLPGLAGLFLVGLLSAAMGNLSAALHTLAGTLYADLVSGWLPRSLPASVAVRALSVLIGVWSTLLVFVVERLGGLVQVAMSLGSVTSGTTLGLFTLGMLVRRANATGALAGACLSLLTTTLIVFGQQSAIATGKLRWPTKPTGVDECPALDVGLSLPATPPTSGAEEAVPAVLRLSYLWLVLLGAGVTVAAGAAASMLASDRPVDPALLFAGPRPQRAPPRPVAHEMDAITDGNEKAAA